MTFINYASREINCKIVYYGPGLCGKTTNLQFIYEKTNPSAKGKLISLATETDRTLFFDFLPLELGNVRGFKTRFHLYTVPGQVFYDASRKLILKGVDGVIFVADSQRERIADNVAAVEERIRPHLTERVELVFEKGYAPQEFHVPDGEEADVVAFGTDTPCLDRWGTPLLFGPGSIRDAHTDHERISKRAFEEPDQQVPDDVPEDLVKAILAARDA